LRVSARKRAGIIDPSGDLKTGPCEICHKVKRLCLDHDWATGLVRGWLCVACNTKLGWLELRRADIEAYLVPHK
jgi:hypothetical protein